MRETFIDQDGFLSSMDLSFCEDFSIENIKAKGDESQVFWANGLLFEDSLRFQIRLQDSVANHSPPAVFFGFESADSVISLGIRSDPSDVLWSSSLLQQHNMSQKKVKRGGAATLHAPGQLVIYPVVRLPGFGLKVRDFIALLETVTQNFLKDLGIVAHTGPSAGLWTKKGKIAFFGIHISKGVSCHGLSINVDNDLRLFSALKSCGESKRSHDKLSFYPQTQGITKRDLFLKWHQKALETQLGKPLHRPSINQTSIKI